MPRVTITRLRLRRGRYQIPFLIRSFLAKRQAERADGGLASTLRFHQGAYWTMTAWRDAAAARAFMLSGAHRAAMPKLAGWCDEASLASWQQESANLPPWDEAERRLAADGRTSVVTHPSPAQAAGLTLGSTPA